MWQAFGVTSFSFEDAFELLEKKFNDNKTLVEVILSELQKGGWLRLEEDNLEISRFKYRLISFREFLERLSKVNRSIGR